MKTRVNILIENQVVEMAHELGLNVSKACETALKHYINALTTVNNQIDQKNININCVEKPRAGFEPATAALPRRCPTRLGYRGARTHISDGTVFYALRIPEAQTLNGIEESANDHSRIGSYSYFGERQIFQLPSVKMFKCMFKHTFTL